MESVSFIDLFAGIGGMRLAFEDLGGECVFSSEWDKFAQLTYEANFGERPFGDIRQIDASDIPPHDVLLAGFPCQPFSLSGVSKKNSLGRPHGFEDPTQGTLFFEIKRILAYHRPSAFLLENVKNLRSHDAGNTYATIMASLRDDLGYTVYSKVIDAAGWVPQHRERIFIVGFRDPVEFDFPEPPTGVPPVLGSVLQRAVNDRYTLSTKLWEYLQAYAAKHRALGHGFGYGLATRKGVARTLSARYHKDGSEILIPQRGKNPRRLTPAECSRLMGFNQLRPKFEIRVSDTQAYRQFGNAVVPPVVRDVGRRMLQSLGRS
jgi:DNA (cytosine-5)-methyltransferase 1